MQLRECLSRTKKNFAWLAKSLAHVFGCSNSAPNPMIPKGTDILVFQCGRTSRINNPPPPQMTKPKSWKRLLSVLIHTAFLKWWVMQSLIQLSPRFRPCHQPQIATRSRCFPGKKDLIPDNKFIRAGFSRDAYRCGSAGEFKEKLKSTRNWLVSVGSFPLR